MGNLLSSILIALLGIVVAWPLVIGFLKLVKTVCYKRVDLPCGSLKVKWVLRDNINVLTRIVSKEFYGGGNIPPEVMAEIYRKYGPKSWEATGRFNDTLRSFISVHLEH